MTVRRLILQKVYDLTDLRSIESSNSDENKVNEEEQVIIECNS